MSKTRQWKWSIVYYKRNIAVYFAITPEWKFDKYSTNLNIWIDTYTYGPDPHSMSNTDVHSRLIVTVDLYLPLCTTSKSSPAVYFSMRSQRKISCKDEKFKPNNYTGLRQHRQKTGSSPIMARNYLIYILMASDISEQSIKTMHTGRRTRFNMSLILNSCFVHYIRFIPKISSKLDTFAVMLLTDTRPPTSNKIILKFWNHMVIRNNTTNQHIFLVSPTPHRTPHHLPNN